jgi:hypothetical protein
LFINNPEKDPKVSISLNAIYISRENVIGANRQHFYQDVSV